MPGPLVDGWQVVRNLDEELDFEGKGLAVLGGIPEDAVAGMVGGAAVGTLEGFVVGKHRNLEHMWDIELDIDQEPVDHIHN